MLGIQFEKAIKFLVKYLPKSEENIRKPILFHDIRVGVYLYENGYADDIIIAGILHDAVEWSSATENEIENEFGENILKLVLANTKNDSISDKNEKPKELIKRCTEFGQDALIIKTADILDSFKWYAKENNKNEIEYCLRNTNAILELKPENYTDKIFDELKIWGEKFQK